MEDGPEEAEGTYSSGGKTYRLEERESWVWKVYDSDDRYIGIVTQSDPTPEDGYRFSAKCAGDEDEAVPTTDDWRAALDFLIDAATT